MWKKTEEPQAPAPARREPPARPQPASSSEVATLGSSITIKGDLTGAEDLVIQGRLEGEVTLKKNNVTVGGSGRVKADIYGRSIRVDGEVTGNLYGEEEVVIRASGRVQGNIVSPRVTLENGANFKGSIDMEPAHKGAPKGAVQPKPKVDQRPAAPAQVSGAKPAPSHG